MVDEIEPIYFQDFSPVYLQKKFGWSSPSKHEKYPGLVERANEWLKANPKYRAKTAESLETRSLGPGGVVDTYRSSTLDSGWSYSCDLSLRLWVVPRTEADPEGPDQIGYINFLPKLLEKPESWLSGTPKFEKFNETLDSLNAHLQENPIPGKVLNVELQDVKFTSWNTDHDSDRTHWEEIDQRGTSHYIWAFRVFYVQGFPLNEVIGSHDVAPALLKEGGSLDEETYEKTGQAIGRASQWIKEQTGIRVTNVTSVNLRARQADLVSAGGLDTMQSWYSNPGVIGRPPTFRLRVLRVFYTRLASSLSGEGQQTEQAVLPTSPPDILYRNFCPGVYNTGGCPVMRVCETQPENLDRLKLWLTHSHASVFSIETLFIHGTGAMTTPRVQQFAEASVSEGFSRSDKFLVAIYRIYFEGDSDPPPEELLPYAADQTECCIII